MFKTDLKKIIAALSLVAFVSGCSPAVGSKDWCEDMKEMDKGQWTAQDAGSFTKHCIM